MKVLEFDKVHASKYPKTHQVVEKQEGLISMKHNPQFKEGKKIKKDLTVQLVNKVKALAERQIQPFL